MVVDGMAVRGRLQALRRHDPIPHRRAGDFDCRINTTLGLRPRCVRFNRQGEFNVPFGRYVRITYQRDFSEYKDVFFAWEFRCGDFEQLELDPEDFVYADPPYDVEFTHYSKEGFNWEDQVRLAEWLSRHRGPVVLSNPATDRIVRLYESLGFRLIFVNGPRMISCTGERKKALEILAIRGM